MTGTRPDAIGVRVPELSGPGAELLARVGALAATSANLHGGPDPHRLEDVPDEIRSACAAVVDGGDLPGTASTVIDFTGEEPAVLREGAVSAAEALERVSASSAPARG
jgi:L-threonylcarbamoyladenylate synthase